MIELNPTANLTGNLTSMDGLLQNSTVDMASTNTLVEASADVSTSMINLPIATDSMNDQLHPANSMDVNLAIAKDIELFNDDLFKAFDEFEQNQRKRYEEVFPEFNIQPSDVLCDSPLYTHDEELRRLKAQVASLEMDKATLTQQLEFANSCIADLQHRVLSFESKDTLSSKCMDDPVDVEYARVMAIEQEIDAQLLSFQTVRQQSRNSMDEVMATLMEQPQKINNECIVNAASTPIELEPADLPLDDTQDTKNFTQPTDLAAADDDWVPICASNDRIMSIIYEFLQAPVEETPKSVDTTPTTDTNPTCNLSTMESNQCLSSPPTSHTCDKIECPSVAPVCSDIEGTRGAIPQVCASVQVNVNASLADANYVEESFSNQADSTDGLDDLVAQVYDAWISDSFLYTSPYSLAHNMQGENRAQDILEKSFKPQSTSKDILDVMCIAKDEAPCGQPSAMIVDGPDSVNTSSEMISSPGSMDRSPCISLPPTDHTCDETQSPSIAATCADTNVDRLSTMCGTIYRAFASEEMDKNAVIADPNYMEYSFSIETDVEGNLVIADPNYLDDSFSIDIKDKDNAFLHSSNYLDDLFSIKADSFNISTDNIESEPHRVTTAMISEKRNDRGLCSHSKIMRTDDYGNDFLETSFEYPAPSKNVMENGTDDDSCREPTKFENPNGLFSHTNMLREVDHSQDFLDESFDIELAPDDIVIKSNPTKEHRLSQISPAFVCVDQSIKQTEPSSNIKFEDKVFDREKSHNNVAKFDDGASDTKLTKAVELREVASVLVQQTATDKRPCTTSPIYKKSNFSKEARLAQPSTCRKMDANISANLDFHLRRRQVHV
ncbi:hypothetical protein Ae201684P_008339 [Aphanomyces euteiches]|uniref:Uncharacterized protein n=1 Tax=Aphanomyces euteiches TaxID=100861 RepID=A0A6G0WF07_9STRA|nr:hypothetical protein Ae201684_016510 [Aphanomyces euteiches]KAH9092669.1 hypothetical protein Ae201684P_008339 [Aphanomyces euteiches]KAH9153175.1 hypothetical protein AeRB84_004515 [Aphanomyces euteiches]